MVGIESSTNLLPRKEIKLVYAINKQRSSAGSNDPTYKLIKKCNLDHLQYDIENEAKKRTIKWNVLDPSIDIKQFNKLHRKMAGNKDIEIISFTSCGSIVIWFSCKTKEALQQLRSIIESGDLQIYLTIIFTLLSDSNEELKVIIKEYITDLKWAEDYLHEKG